LWCRSRWLHILCSVVWDMSVCGTATAALCLCHRSDSCTGAVQGCLRVFWPGGRGRGGLTPIQSCQASANRVHFVPGRCVGAVQHDTWVKQYLGLRHRGGGVCAPGSGAVCCKEAVRAAGAHVGSSGILLHHVQPSDITNVQYCSALKSSMLCGLAMATMPLVGSGRV